MISPDTLVSQIHEEEEPVHVPVEGGDSSPLPASGVLRAGVAGVIIGVVGTLIVCEHLEALKAQGPDNIPGKIPLPQLESSYQAHIRNLGLQLRLSLLPHNIEEVPLVKLQRLEGELKALSPAELERCRNIFDQNNSTGRSVSDAAIDWLDEKRGLKTPRAACVESILTILGYDTKKNLVEL
jgi:hypothetical protein